jgi:hypothetical protein
VILRAKKNGRPHAKACGTKLVRKTKLAKHQKREAICRRGGDGEDARDRPQLQRQPEHDFSAHPFEPGLISAMIHKRTVVLIGTSHTYQRPGHPNEGGYRKLINEVCSALKIRGIAEKLSREALAQRAAFKSI